MEKYWKIKKIWARNLAILIFFIAIILAIIIPSYVVMPESWYTDQMLLSINPIKERVENQLKNNENVDTDIPQHLYGTSGLISEVIILSSGTILVRGGRHLNEGGRYDQLVALLPSIQSSGIVWRCIGGNARAMPQQCRDT